MSRLRGGFVTPQFPIPLLPLRRGVVFPGTRITLPVGRERSIALLRAIRPGDIIAVASQRDPSVVDPAAEDLHAYGSFARVHQVGRRGPDEYRLVLEGVGRFHLDRIVATEPFWQAEGQLVEESTSDPAQARLLARALRDHVQELVAQGAGLSEIAASDEEPGVVADQVASCLDLGTAKELEVLQTLDVVERLKLVTRLLAESKTLGEIKRQIESDVRREIGKAQREALLREQLKAIKNQLNGGESGDDPLSLLRQRLDDAELPEDVRKVADRELGRLEAMNEQGPEANVIRTYLEWIADLPWAHRASVSDDLNRVSDQLEDDHFGLGDVKKRILEHLAVMKLSGNPRGSILCLVGPPGVGKTSLGQSIADATGRPFVRIALGGVRDEAEIRGHRRTYVGALPGRIVHALRKAKVKNPVVLLDEIDKLHAGWQGSPEAALLEVLDPEQNKTFTDHYLEQPFDLSEVVFICTANTLETLSPPLRDRLDIVEVNGYTPEEKLQIARRHLLPKLLKETGVAPDHVTITDGAISLMVERYTREAGVRQLNRELLRLLRAIALSVARSKDDADAKVSQLSIDEGAVPEYLGRERFHSEVAERTAAPGVATGLAWTPVGGDILFVEATRMPGKGRLEITGQLGDVMKESARAALSFVRSNAHKLGVEPNFLETQDLHVHVPAGAVPKDGPSAGVTMFTALTSLLTGRRVRSDTAMTGEVTLRGRVLPVGGIKAKVLAAHRAGITRIVLPHRNERDLDDVPKEARDALEFLLVDDMSQVLEAALEPDGGDQPQPVLGGLPHDGPTSGLNLA